MPRPPACAPIAFGWRWRGLLAYFSEAGSQIEMPYEAQ